MNFSLCANISVLCSDSHNNINLKDHLNSQETCEYLKCWSIKFCIYNFVLNKAPNSNYAAHVAINVHLTFMGAQGLSMTVI